MNSLSITPYGGRRKRVRLVALLPLLLAALSVLLLYLYSATIFNDVYFVLGVSITVLATPLCGYLLYVGLRHLFEPFPTIVLTPTGLRRRFEHGYEDVLPWSALCALDLDIERPRLRFCFRGGHTIRMGRGTLHPLSKPERAQVREYVIHWLGVGDYAEEESRIKASGTRFSRLVLALNMVGIIGWPSIKENFGFQIVVAVQIVIFVPLLILALYHEWQERSRMRALFERYLADLMLGETENRSRAME